MLVRCKQSVRFIVLTGFSLVFGVGLLSSSHAAADAPAAASSAPADKIKADPVTTNDPEIALDDLELLLALMTKEEIETETKGRFALVRAKEREISVAELDIRRKNREIAQLGKQKAAGPGSASDTRWSSRANSYFDTAQQSSILPSNNLLRWFGKTHR